MMKQINRDDALFIIITGNSRESLRAKRIGCSATAHIFDCFKIVKINFRQVIPCVCPFWNKIDYIQYALFIEQNLQRMQDLLASNKFAETIPSVLFVRALTWPLRYLQWKQEVLNKDQAHFEDCLAFVHFFHPWLSVPAWQMYRRDVCLEIHNIHPLLHLCQLPGHYWDKRSYWWVQAKKRVSGRPEGEDSLDEGLILWRFHSCAICASSSWSKGIKQNKRHSTWTKSLSLNSPWPFKSLSTTSCQIFSKIPTTLQSSG